MKFNDVYNQLFSETLSVDPEYQVDTNQMDHLSFKEIISSTIKNIQDFMKTDTFRIHDIDDGMVSFKDTFNELVYTYLNLDDGRINISINYPELNLSKDRTVKTSDPTTIAEYTMELLEDFTRYHSKEIRDYLS